MYIKCMTSRVLDWRGQPAGVLTVLRDVTAEHKTDQLRNQYLSIVAHELRTPLTLLIAPIESLRSLPALLSQPGVREPGHQRGIGLSGGVVVTRL